MTPWIQHFSEAEIVDGLHYAVDHKTVLIQIRDHDHRFVLPKYEFSSVHQFVFDDVTDETDPNCIKHHQASIIAMILQSAYANNQNVLVHCYAGLCRSSAVAICGQRVGFALEDKVRWPNSLVELRIKTALGLAINPSTSMFNGD